MENHKYITYREFRLPTKIACSTYLLYVELAFLALQWQGGFENGMKVTPNFTYIT